MAIGPEVKFHNHPDLVRCWEIWKALEAFTDGHTWSVSRYLVKHPSEADNSIEGALNYGTRLNRLYNVNYCAPHLQQHHAHLSQPMTIAGAAQPRMKAVTEDVTGYGDTYEKFGRDRLWYYLRDGKVATLVDGPSSVAASRAEAQKNNERSYQVIYTARQIRYWEHFESGPRKGQLRKVVLEEKPKFDAESGTEISRFRYFEQPEPAAANFMFAVLEGTEEAVPAAAQAFDPTAPWWASKPREFIDCGERGMKVIESGTGSLAYIPVFIMGDSPEESFLADVWQLNLTYMNLLSVLSNIIYNQGFQKSIFAGVQKEELAKMSEWLATVVSNPEIKVFTVDPGNPEAVFRELSNLEQQISRRAKFEYNQLADDTRHVQSASSKSKDLITRQAIYDQTVDLWTETERRIYRAHAELEAASADSVDVHIDRDYGLDDYREREIELLTIFNQARELGVLELQKEVIKMRVAKLRFLPRDGKSEEEVRQEMLKAVDAAKPPMAQAMGAVQGLGNKVFGPNGEPATKGAPSVGGSAKGKGPAQPDQQGGNLFGDNTGVSSAEPSFPSGGE